MGGAKPSAGLSCRRGDWRARKLVEEISCGRRVYYRVERSDSVQFGRSRLAALSRGDERLECFDPLANELRRLGGARYMCSNPTDGHRTLLAVRLFRPKRVHDTRVTKLTGTTATNRRRTFERMVEAKPGDVVGHVETPKVACGSPSARAVLFLTGPVQKMKVGL